MALKKATQNKEESIQNIEEKYAKIIEELQERIDKLEAKSIRTKAERSINQVEEFNGEEESIIETYNSGLDMKYADKIISARNACKILPPNLIEKSGKHARSNIEAICGFKIDDEMYEEIYTNFVQESY